MEATTSLVKGLLLRGRDGTEGASGGRERPGRRKLKRRERQKKRGSGLRFEVAMAAEPAAALGGTQGPGDVAHPFVFI